MNTRKLKNGNLPRLPYVLNNFGLNSTRFSEKCLVSNGEPIYHGLFPGTLAYLCLKILPKVFLSCLEMFILILHLLWVKAASGAFRMQNYTVLPAHRAQTRGSAHLPPENSAKSGQLGADSACSPPRCQPSARGWAQAPRRAPEGRSASSGPAANMFLKIFATKYGTFGLQIFFKIILPNRSPNGRAGTFARIF